MIEKSMEPNRGFLRLLNIVASEAFKGTGPQTIECVFYESLHVAEQFATNFMKINQGIRKL